MLKDFNKIADMPQDVIDKYRDQVPSELLQIWQDHTRTKIWAAREHSLERTR